MNQSNTTKHLTIRKMSRQSSLIYLYIRYDGEVETKPNGRKQITRCRPKLIQLNEQIVYCKNVAGNSTAY